MNSATANKHAGKTVKVKQVGSPMRRDHTQRETLIGLKLNKIGRISELVDELAVALFVSLPPLAWFTCHVDPPSCYQPCSLHP